MKRSGVAKRPRPQAVHAAPRGARTTRRPPVATRTRIRREPTVCERCGAVYRRSTWRAAERARRTPLIGVGWTLCPACAQVEDQEYFGRIRIARLARDLDEAVRRRIWNVERRARHTQPERRTVRIDRARSGLEILTTSQKLAHRIARELEKAFGGRARFVWSDREGMLDASWAPPVKELRPHVRPRRPRIKRRTLESVEVGR